MPFPCCRVAAGAALFFAADSICAAQNAAVRTLIETPSYSVRIAEGEPPRLTIERNDEPIFEVPVVSGLSSSSAEERLSDVRYAVRPAGTEPLELDATAKSTLWTNRRFVWRFLPDHIEFQQFASGHGALGRAYFLSNGVSKRWEIGTTGGHRWATRIDADRYLSPAPNHANQYEFTIAMPQTLGFGQDAAAGTESDFRPERMNGIFQPPPLFLAFHLDRSWMGLGIGTKPGEYQFPALEYTGSRYAGASFYADYLGYRNIDGEFSSPVLALTFAYDPLDALERYTRWLDEKGFSTRASAHDAYWHHLPIFCGWAEQTVESVPIGEAPNTLATQANYEKWIGVLEQRGMPVGTIILDDKWQQNYGTFEVDTRKWPDLKGFVAAQHAKGRHVLLWVPLAQGEGLPAELCITVNGRCAGADVGKPEYEGFLRARVHHLVADIGVDGFKEDWVGAPTQAGLPLSGGVAGLEFVRRFQWILYDEAHKAKADAMVETQTVNALFRESSDVTRLNDIWYGTRNVPDALRLRARIAHISGWPLVDTDNASSTTQREWWDYMQAQPSIGIPALYFITRTESTQEAPTDAQWSALNGIWQAYIDQLPGEKP